MNNINTRNLEMASQLHLASLLGLAKLILTLLSSIHSSNIHATSIFLQAIYHPNDPQKAHNIYYTHPWSQKHSFLMTGKHKDQQAVRHITGACIYSGIMFISCGNHLIISFLSSTLSKPVQ
jgi:hypothetical protein